MTPYTYIPDPKGRHKLTKVEDAVSFRKREHLMNASLRKFTFDILPKTTEWMQIEVTDGHHRKNILEFYDGIGQRRSCTCDQYFEDQSGWCIHLGAIHGVTALKWDQSAQNRMFCLDFAREKTRVPIFPPAYRNGAMWWNPFNLSQEVVGRTPVPTENWKAYIVWKTARPSTTLKIGNTKYSSHGLLGGGITLFDYQENVFGKMLNSKRAICSMTMGAGKTLTTIACISEIFRQNALTKTLIIAPKSLCIQWDREVKRATHIRSKLLKTEKDVADMAVATSGVFITTYQYVTRHIDLFAKQEYDVCVVDEIQFVKNGDSKTWKALSQISSEYFYGLSGTVIENRLDDLYSIMDIINPGVLGPKWKFDDTFQEIKNMSNSKIIYTGVKNLDYLKIKLQDHVFFYDQINLPAISHNYIQIPCDAQEKSSHDHYLEKARELMAMAMNGNPSPQQKIIIQSLLLRARQCSNTIELLTKQQRSTPANKIVKFLQLVNHICNIDQEKVVVFSEWTEMLGWAKFYLKTLSSPPGYVSFTGQESAKQRDQAVQDFKTDPKCMIFFASDAGGVGLDGLQMASRNVIHLELPWNPARLDQRTGRVHRLLQTKDVNAYYLVSQGTIEQQIETLLTEKRDIRIKTLMNFR